MGKINLKAKRKTSSLRNLLKKPSKAKNSKTKSWKDVHHEKHFWVNDGKILKNLNELPSALRKMNKEAFSHHVNEHKNDFANWIEHVVGEKKLAKEVRTLQSKSAIMKAVKARL